MHIKSTHFINFKTKRGNPMLAYCGINCTTCPAFIATQNNDDIARQKLAAEWSNEQYFLKPSDINCDGCLANGSTIISFCRDCPTRNCAIVKQVQNCAHCEEFACENLQKHWKMAGMTEEKHSLEEIHRNLRN
jgi:hypothetical protein